MLKAEKRKSHLGGKQSSHQMKKSQCGRYTIWKQNHNNLIKLLYHLHKIDRMVILFFFFPFSILLFTMIQSL